MDRKEALNKIEQICKSIEDIDGVLLVGSGAVGFTDKWSDIDLSVVISKEEKTRQVWQKINEEIISQFDLIKIFYTEYGDNNFLSGVLLNNYLEIDIGVLSINKLVAKGRSWSVLYDKSGVITQKMNNTWEERKIQNITVEIEDSLSTIWYHFKNAAFALERKKFYRAIKEIEEVRNEIVEIRALQENRIAKHFRDVDNMDKLFLEKLEKTFFKELTISEISKSLVNTFNLYFDLIKEIYQNCEEVIQYEHKLRRLLSELGLIKLD